MRHVAGERHRVAGLQGHCLVGDLDGDGWAELVVSSWDHHLYVLDHSGAVRRSLFLKDTAWASPAVVDVDRDGIPEIVAAWDCDANSTRFDCAYGNPGGTPARFALSVFEPDVGTAPRKATRA